LSETRHDKNRTKGKQDLQDRLF